MTHLDKDHIGGAARILENFPVERLVQADYDEDSGPYEKYQEAWRRPGADAAAAAGGDDADPGRRVADPDAGRPSSL